MRPGVRDRRSPLRRWGATGAALVLGASGPLGVGLVSAPPAVAAPQTFPYTGAPQLYVVPPGVTSIQVVVSGAQGDSPAGGGVGGLGGMVEATIAVTPGESLQIMVGGSGSSGGYNGGARGAGNGGGASDVRRPAFSTSSSCAFDLTCGLGERIVVAGGGGGGASLSLGVQVANGGAGGNPASAGTAIDDTVGGVFGNATGGEPGTLLGGGSGGAGTRSAGQGAAGGTSGVGGEGAWVAGATGGGGGGGYFGGGGGGVSDNGLSPYAPNGAGGGGGGSSWAGGAGASGSVFSQGVRSGNGVVTVDPPSAITGAAFGFTGAPQYYTVPLDITTAFVRLYGGSGGGAGDVVYGRLPVTPGETLQLNLGGRGWGVGADAGFTDFQGGWNGGGAGQAGWPGGTGASGTGGGGASDVRRCASPPCALTDRLLVAGGGGGGSVGAWGLGGGTGGGGFSGPGNNGTTTGGGGGASLSAGGVSGGGAATAGTLGVGGQGETATAGGGGGGGGYYGGGGGSGGGGGGGSSYASETGAGGSNVLGLSGAAFAHSGGGAFGNGLAIITAMPIGVTTSANQITYTSAFIRGSVNPKYLASTPKVFYSSVDETTVATGGGSSVSLAGPASASVLAGSTVQSVSGSVTGLTPGTTYYYRVCAQSVAGNGCGAVKSFSTPPNGFPYFTADTPDDTATAGTVYTSYTFTATSSPSQLISFGVASGTLPPGLTFDDSTGVLAGTPTTAGTYTFTIRATNASGTTTTSSRTITVAANPAPPTPPSPVPPSAPTNATATAGNGQASISWVPPANPGTFPVTSYQVTASPGGQSCLTSSTSCTITGLTNGTTYTFTVAALNGAGWGASATSNAVTPSVNPAPTPAPGPQPLPTPLPPGGSSLTVNGVPQQMTVAPNTSDNGLQIVSDDFDMSLDGLGPDGQPMDLGPDGVLLLDQEREAQSSGRGFLGRSDVDFYIDPPVSGPRSARSAGLFVGTLVTASDGTFAGRITLPDSITAGDHVLQAVGLTAAGQPRAVSIGVRVNAWIQLAQGARVASGRHDRIRTNGDSAGIPSGTRLTPWIRYTGQDAFREGTATIIVRADGSFRWTRQIRKDKAVTAYVAFTDIESNRVTWARVR